MSEFVCILFSYAVGLVIGGMIALKDVDVTAKMIYRANTVCAENQGLKVIEPSKIICINGATFERGDQ